MLDLQWLFILIAFAAGFGVGFGVGRKGLFGRRLGGLVLAVTLPVLGGCSIGTSGVSFVSTFDDVDLLRPLRIEQQAWSPACPTPPAFRLDLGFLMNPPDPECEGETAPPRGQMPVRVARKPGGKDSRGRKADWALVERSGRVVARATSKAKAEAAARARNAATEGKKRGGR